MDTTHIVYTHIVLAILVFTFLLATVINSSLGLAGKRVFGNGDRKIALLGLIFSHIQLLLGIFLWFVSPKGKQVFGMMKEADLRLTSLEHPLVNIIAIVLITVGWSRHKRLSDSGAKFKSFLIFYGIAILLLLSRIPWTALAADLKTLIS